MALLALVFGLIANVSAAQEWIKICNSSRKTCAAGQAQSDKDDPSVYVKVLFSFDEQHNLRLSWVSPKLHRPEIVIALNGYQFGTAFPQKCSENDCEGMVMLRDDEKHKMFAAKDLTIELELADDKGVRFTFDLTDLDKALAQP